MKQLQAPSSSTSIFPVYIGIGALILAGFMFSAREEEGNSILIAVVALALLGLIFIRNGLRPVLQARFLSEPSIAISTDQIRIGETIDLHFQQTVKKNLQIERISFKLMFREVARYSSGTDTSTATQDHKIDQFGHNDLAVNEGHVFDDHWQFQIPQGQMHTFHSTNNRTEWYLLVEINVAKKFTFKRTYPMTVLPEVISPDAA